jgi:aminoglycoside phosphotransferase (APT) family kinase protein
MLDVDAMPGHIGRWLTTNVRPATVHGYEIMTGGFSRVMARVDVEWHDDGSRETFVLRGDPPAHLATLESDRDAEWSLLSDLALAGTIPVPAGRWYVDDPSHFGSKALFIEHVPSRTLQACLDDGLDHGATAERLVDLMADVASVPPERMPSLAVPASWDAYIDTKIAGWQRMADTHVEAVPIIQYLTSWMDAHRPAPLPFRLVHGDLQAANIIVTPDDRWHLIDWEFARIGDPREDLGYYNAYSGAVPPNLAERDLAGFLARFRERTGFDEEAVNPATYAWFTILSTLSAVDGLHQGAAGMARGERQGTAVAYNAILVTVGYQNFLNAIAALEATS